MKLLRLAALLLPLFATPALADGASSAKVDMPTDKPVELMFVQTAKSISFDGKTLTLEGLPPATLFFADRPDRLVGHLTNETFVELWTYNADGFAADPPNAALSLLDSKDSPPIVVELSKATIKGDSITYEVRVLDGELPKTAGAATLFIDPWVYVPPGPRWGWHCWWNRWGNRVCGY